MAFTFFEKALLHLQWPSIQPPVLRVMRIFGSYKSEILRKKDIQKKSETFRLRTLCMIKKGYLSGKMSRSVYIEEPGSPIIQLSIVAYNILLRFFIRFN